MFAEYVLELSKRYRVASVRIPKIQIDIRIVGPVVFQILKLSSFR
jgi:hypothetical protein